MSNNSDSFFRLAEGATLSNILSRRDVQFLLYEWLEVDKLTSRARFAEHSRETFDAVLDLSEQLATESFATHNRKGDLFEPTFDGEKVHLIPEVAQAIKAFAGADLLAATMDHEVGGMQLPSVVFGACMAWFYGANAGTVGYLLLSIGNANLLLEHGSPEQIERFVKPVLSGRFLGTMALSEPHAGSSLADLTTRAEPQEDGTYRVFGQKMWISGGDHELSENIVHLVLAKIPGGPAGTKGISLFVVPKYLVNDDGSLGERNDVVLTGINHKMGFRGTVNTAPSFGEGAHRPGGQAGAVGYLVGEPHRGLSYMFRMMNEARIGIGLCATALGYTGYLKSLEYARSRPQGRELTNTDASTPQINIVEHTDVRRMLLAQKAYVEGALALNLYCGKLVDDIKTAEDEQERAAAKLLLDTLTPITKSWPSQWCLEANNLAIQVLGGAGYTRDYDVEQHYRDNRLNPIHEGTHGIQALDLLGRKIFGSNGAGLLALKQAIDSTLERARQHEGDATQFADQLDSAVTQLAETTGKLVGLGEPNRIMANATVYLEAAGHIVLSWIWLEQFLATGNKEGDFYEGKRQATRYFFNWELPKTGPQMALLASGDDTTLTMQDAWF